MATTREIKNRINSVRDTQKITNAMYLISSTKMRKARREAEESKPYYELLRRELRRMFAVSNDIRSKYVDSSVDDEAPGGNFGILVITADKGLAGSYNQNVIREALALMDRADESKLYVVGEFGRRFFRAGGFPIIEEFDHMMREPDLDDARTITVELLDTFDRGDFESLYVCSTDYTGGLSAGNPTHYRLIPFDRDDFVPEVAGETNALSTFEYEPDVVSVLERIVPSALTGYIYAALVNSYSSEQSARMMAMDAANDNASELLEELSLEYNHLRQNAITQEITEISSGARGLRKSRAKRKKAEED